MPVYSLKAQTRDIKNQKNDKLREEFLIPAVLYGPETENKNLVVKRNDFLKIWEKTGSSSLIDLQIDDNQSVKILIQDYQFDPQTDELIHIDFYKIQEGKKITTEVDLNFIGEAPAVKELGGILVKNYNEIEIECLPKDLEKIDTIKVDLSVLKDFSDAIHIKDLQVPEGIKIMDNPDEVIVLAAPPREEEKEEIVPAEGEAAEIPEEGKEEDKKLSAEEKEQKESEEKSAE